jgi:hypothetical protein
VWACGRSPDFAALHRGYDVQRVRPASGIRLNGELEMLMRPIGVHRPPGGLALGLQPVTVTDFNR